MAHSTKIQDVFRDIARRAVTLSESLEERPEDKVELYRSTEDTMSLIEYWALVDIELLDLETRMQKIIDAIGKHHVKRADIINRVFGGRFTCVT